MLLDARQTLLSQMSPHYDEAFNEIASRVDVNGCLSKSDIGALVFWKRINASTTWARKLHAVSDDRVRGVTGQAVSHVKDASLTVMESARAERSALTELPGFHRGDASLRRLRGTSGACPCGLRSPSRPSGTTSPS